MKEYFEPGVDYVSYESIEEIPALINYYMKNEKEREKIAENGYNKVKEYHSFKNRVNDILNIVFC